MYSQETSESIKQRILNDIKNIDKREGSYTYNMIAPVSDEMAKVYTVRDGIITLAFVEDSYGPYLEMRTQERGIYRKLGEKATGTVTVTGTVGTTIVNGSILLVNDLEYILLNDVIVGTENIGYIEAIDVGRKYNQLSDTSFILRDSISGINTITNTIEINTGIDIETDEELKIRYYDDVDDPATSGNAAHYRKWALEVNGVYRAIVKPRWNGRGTVKVLIIGKDNEPVTNDILNSCISHIEEEMPLSELVLTVVTPTVSNLDISANVDVAEGYTIDEVKIEFEGYIQEYLATTTTTIVYNKIAGMLASMISVSDYDTLLVNKSTSNIVISDDIIYELNEVVLNEII